MGGGLACISPTMVVALFGTLSTEIPFADSDFPGIHNHVRWGGQASRGSQWLGSGLILRTYCQNVQSVRISVMPYGVSM